ncbi:uncharacterized protein LOC143227853 isoform X3 [Tachypleus tridentatus]|uniref:uncharacterized protein LOC143227853 isoform X3 n=1 Tax=Tachypleus tridentatus TaxID=6853 RepID=UPI003FD1859F
MKLFLCPCECFYTRTAGQRSLLSPAFGTERRLPLAMYQMIEKCPHLRYQEDSMVLEYLVV